MKRCLELALLGNGNTAPNPMVGAVLVYNDRIIGEGWHKQYGEAHAEVNCLQSVKEEDRHLIAESTMYVSLEPCAHYGQTPPCALRLVQEKVKQVIVCNTDPFEKVEGRGLQILKEHNIPVQTGIMENEGRWLNRRFFCFHQQKRPYIILKWVETSTGLFAPANKERYQLSNRHSMQLVHKWRTEEAAIMVGYNTALNDDPQLTARLWDGRQPLRIVLDRDLKLPTTHKLFNTEAETWVINEHQQTATGNISYQQIPFDNNLLPELLNRLHEAGKLSLIVEGGAQLLQSFIEKGYWDEARVFTATTSIKDGIPSPALKNAEAVADFDIDSDVLRLYVNSRSAYPYVTGMEL